MIAMTNTIEANTLRDWLESHQPVTVLDVRSVGLIRFRGHFPKGGYDVHTDGRNNSQAPAPPPAVR